jgi:hypothetical protein
MTQRFTPTVNEESLIGGSRSFGTEIFVPSITNLSGAHTAYGRYQRMSSIIVFSIALVGTSTTASSVLSLPIKPYMRELGSGIEIIYKGVLFDDVLIDQNADGTFDLSDDTVTGDVRRITGFYWVE